MTGIPDGDRDRLLHAARKHAKRSRNVETIVLVLIVALWLSGAIEMTWWQATALCCVALVVTQLIMNTMMGAEIRREAKGE